MGVHLKKGEAMATKPFCKLCGSIEVVMDASGLFVCSDCGARYTTEAMRDLISANSSESNSPADNESSTEKVSTPDSALLIEDIDEEAESLIEQYLNKEYELAAASWESLKGTDAASHPWVTLVGLLSTSISAESDSSCNVGIAYRQFKRQCNHQCSDPKVEGRMALAAIKECTAVTNEIVSRQLNLLNRRHDGVTVTSKQLITPDLISAFLDSARFQALLQISSCIRRGYIPSNTDWHQLKETIEYMEPVNRVPLINRILKRTTVIVANQKLPDQYDASSNNVDPSSVLLSAHELWVSGDYDLAYELYRTLREKNDEYIASEAAAASKLFELYVDDQSNHFKFYPKWMKESIERSSTALMKLGGSKSIDSLLRIGQLSHLSTELTSHYTRTASLYMNDDVNKGSALVEAAENYLQLTNDIINSAFESIQFVLTTDSSKIEIDKLKLIYSCLNGVSSSVNESTRSQLTLSLKKRFNELVTEMPEYKEELSSVLESCDSQLSELEQLINKAESVLNDTPFYALSKTAHIDEGPDSLQAEKDRVP